MHTSSPAHSSKVKATKTQLHTGPGKQRLLHVCFLILSNGLIAAHALGKAAIKQQQVKALIVSALPEAPCSSLTGNYVNLVALRNREDYAMLHGYSTYWSRQQTDRRLRGPWNKVGLLLQLLQQTARQGQPHYEWFMWTDADTLFANMTFATPFEQYVGKDIVIPGDRDKALVELDAEGINTGVMLVRNSPRSLHFFQDLAALGYKMQLNTSETSLLVANSIRRYHAALYDQNAVIYLLKTQPQHQAAVAFEPVGGYGLHSHFVANLPLPMIAVWGLPLITHYAGCNLCPEGDRVAIYGQHYCLKHFFTIHNMAANISNAVLGIGAAPLSVTDVIAKLDGFDDKLDAEFKA